MGFIRPMATVMAAWAGGPWPSPRHLLNEPAHASRVRRARNACGHRTAGASGGAAADGGSVALVVRG
jgi:hypothetical protein